MTQNVKYDVTTGKVYEELGCPSNNNQNDTSKGNSMDVCLAILNLMSCFCNKLEGV